MSPPLAGWFAGVGAAVLISAVVFRLLHRRDQRRLIRRMQQVPKHLIVAGTFAQFDYWRQRAHVHDPYQWIVIYASSVMRIRGVGPVYVIWYGTFWERRDLMALRLEITTLQVLGESYQDARYGEERLLKGVPAVEG